jgi:hypothetical protein
VIENTFVEAVHVCEPMRGGKFNSRLPFFVAVFQSRW